MKYAGCIRRVFQFALMIGVAHTWAQDVTLRGRVQDATGEQLRSTQVVVAAYDHVPVAKTISNQQGQFEFTAKAGTYEVSVSAPGFTDFGPVSANFAPGVITAVTMPAGVIDHTTVPDQKDDKTASPFANSMPWEYGALVQGGNGLTEDRNGFHFMSAGVHVGKVLTPEIGHGALKGNFEYAVEVYPFWQSYTPKFQKASCFAVPTAGTSFIGPGLYCSPLYTVGGTFTGATITPIILRWNFTHGKKFMPWAQAAGGLLWTNHKYPAFGSSVLNLGNDGPNSDASVFNFTPQGGIGMHYFVKPTRSVDFSANAVHISSASLGDKNPGVNASVQFTLGYTWWKK